MLEIRDLTKRYGAVLALDRVTLEIGRREIFGLVGPNGAGKTTLLKILLGLVRPTSGEARLAGIDVRRRPVAARARAGYLPGDASLYEGLRGGAFLRFALAFHPSIDASRRDALLGAFELPLRERVRAYSHGMKRKLALVAALAPEVPVYLLDEPTEGLDPSVRIHLVGVLEALRARGATVVFSSHDLAEVERLCDRVAFLDRGRILDCDTVARIRERAARILRVAFRVPVHAEELRGDGIEAVEEHDGEFLLRLGEDPGAALRRLAALPVAAIEWNRLSLDRLYADLYGVRP